MLKIGHGFDIHQLVDEPGEGIHLAGLLIPHTKTILAHSDGDVVLHAIIDALLGALALGDIGQWFPDTDPKYKGASSSDLLAVVLDEIHTKGYQVSNVDVTIIAQKPKLAPHIIPMRENVSKLLSIALDCVSIKAKTHEKVDAVGQQKAVVAHCVMLLHERND